MKSTPWTRRFEKSCRDWQTKFGLMDWSITFKTDRYPDAWARVEYNVDVRSAVITSNVNMKGLGERAPERIALHEMLHLLLADTIATAGLRGADHVDTGRAEHMLIERLLNVIEGRL